MAITSEQLQTSIEKFLPRGLNTSRDADSGSLSEDEIAERALLIARISLLLDIESPFQPLSTAVQSFGDGLQTILDSFAELTGDDLLLSLRDEAPSYIDDLSKLESARSNLIGVANTANLDDTFSDTKLDEFASDVDDFLTENIVGKVVNRNRVVIRDEAKALYATLEPLWETALEKKTELLAQVESFVDLDLKKTVVTEIVLAIKQQMDDTISELEEANAEEQAALAEEILCDMAAARAVMKIIQNAPAMESDEVGDPVVIPVIGEAGSTPDDYLQRQGKAILEPIDVVELPSTARYGTGGKISITSIYAGSTGIAPDDGDGDYTTPDSGTSTPRSSPTASLRVTTCSWSATGPPTGSPRSRTRRTWSSRQSSRSLSSETPRSGTSSPTPLSVSTSRTKTRTSGLSTTTAPPGATCSSPAQPGSSRRTPASRAITGPTRRTTARRVMGSRSRTRHPAQMVSLTGSTWRVTQVGVA